MYSTWMVWGEYPASYENNPEHKSFNTPEELDAYLQGVNDMTGLADVANFGSEAEAKEYINEICPTI